MTIHEEVPVRALRNRRNALLAVSLALAAGCASPPDGPPPAAIGGDRDAHGCIGSAGYSWCERSGQCERPWELAAREGFDNSAEAYDRYCSMPATGNGADSGAESDGG